MILAAAAEAVHASSTVGGITFGWELNLTTFGVVGAGAFTWWMTVLRLGDKVKITAAELRAHELKAAAELIDLRHDVEQANNRALKIDAELRLLREEVYKEYISVNTWREINGENRKDQENTEKRIMNAIGELTRRVDSFAHSSRLR